MSKFEWVNFRVDVTTDDDAPEGSNQKKYVIFELSEPIDEVVGSQTLASGTGVRSAIRAYDVTEVRCFIELIDNEEFVEGFKFEMDADENPTGPGKYAGDLTLDVSQGNHVWLVAEKLSKRSFDFKAKKRNEKVAEIIRRQQELEAKRKAGS